jgi:LacI family transcriptional regulator
MTVGQLCKSIAVSRRSLERKMVRSLGRTPAEEIRRIRIEAARTLLRRQDIVLADVAQAVGYASQSSFTNAFVQVCGMTPGRWRRERLAEAS